MDLMKALTSQYMKKELPEMNVGDTVRVHVKIKEGSRERIQIFEGTIIAKKHGGIEESITVRRISYGVGCEKVFPVHAPNVVDVETVRHGKVRRAKLYYLRDRLGKAAKVKERFNANRKETPFGVSFLLVWDGVAFNGPPVTAAAAWLPLRGSCHGEAVTERENLL